MRVWRDQNPCALQMRMKCFYGTICHRNQQKVQSRVTLWPSHLTPQFTQENWKHVHTKICTNIHNNITHYRQKWKQSKWKLMNGWAKWMNIIQPSKGMKYWQYATAWINLENFMLSERNQTQKITYCMILLHVLYNSSLIHFQRCGWNMTIFSRSFWKFFSRGFISLSATLCQWSLWNFAQYNLLLLSHWPLGKAILAKCPLCIELKSISL